MIQPVLSFAVLIAELLDQTGHTKLVTAHEDCSGYGQFSSCASLQVMIDWVWSFRARDAVLCDLLARFALFTKYSMGAPAYFTVTLKFFRLPSLFTRRDKSKLPKEFSRSG